MSYYVTCNKPRKITNSIRYYLNLNMDYRSTFNSINIMSTNENIFCVSTNIFIHKNFAFHWIRYSFNMAIHFCLFFGILVFGTAHITFSGHIICNINTKNLTVITNEINQFTKFKWSNKFFILVLQSFIPDSSNITHEL